MGDVATEWPHDGVAVITLDHPAIRNHLSFAAVSEIAEALLASKEAGARVWVLASAVDGHWWEHAWLPDLLSPSLGTRPTAEPGGFRACLEELAKSDVISIAAISGDTSGGGCELGWACDLRIAEEQARFAQPEVSIGLTTGIGGTSRLARLLGRTATAEMVMFGAPMTAQRIYELGGVNRVVPNGKAVEVAVTWASELAQRPPEALKGVKRILRDSDDLHLTDALTREQQHFQSVLPSGLDQIAAVQARFDAGEDPRAVYGDPRP